VTCFAPLVVLTAVAREARGWIDPAVDLVLREIVSPVRQGPLRRIFKLVARLELFLVIVAVSAEGFHVADVADLPLLLRVEFVTCFAEVGGVVQGCAPVCVAVGADGQRSHDFSGMFFCQACGSGAGK